ncbi:hypothetical protein BMF94_0802 [Rhodotorula taiwanensis]|uniref:GPI-anchored wall transfer protein n=1 Tax=Rhodotorula taiwanensis TaxID=741276 RepID=A0A2S5BH28_9BASI|nr:hypothetical protein BMF94_0802 [Rhodotorula taiwanensis]
MPSQGYHEAKIAFVSDLEGGSVTRINLVCATAISTYAMWIYVHERVLVKGSKDSLRTPLTEFSVLILPLLLALTAFASTYGAAALNVVFVLAGIACSCLPLPPSSPPLSPSLERKPQLPSGNDVARTLFSQPFVTTYRAIMMVMTVLCILAVDFPIFPREFAKAETWGTSLMDLGVGSFVFSLGLVSALPLLRRALSLPSPTSSSPALSTSTSRGHDQDPSYLSTIWTSLRRSLPLIALGMVRVIMVKGVEYPEHVTEYGVHWNFFFTLALLPVLGAGIERWFFVRAIAIEDPDNSERRSFKVDMHAIALGVGIVNQTLLTLTPLQRWALTAERTGLISQNKEGLVSLPGYLAIYLLGLATGLYTFPPSPTFFRTLTTRLPRSAPSELIQKLDAKRDKVLGRRSSSDDPPSRRGEKGGQGGASSAVARRNAGQRKKAEWLVSAAVWWWILYGIATFGVGARVSRRLANLTYVVWVAAFNSTFLAAYLILHLTLVGRASGKADSMGSAPAIFEAINRNGLVVFLVANLMTGLVNVSLETMYASSSLAICVLTLYAAVVVGCAWALRGKRVKLS